MEEKKDYRNIIVGILIFMVIVLIGFIVYYSFIKKDNQPINNGNSNNIVSEPISKNKNTESKSINENNNTVVDNEDASEDYRDFTPEDFNSAITTTDKNVRITYEFENATLPKNIEGAYQEDDKFTLSTDGKVTISYGENNIVELSNISSAKNIAQFSPHGNIYILLSNGDVYEYGFNELNSQNYNAKKIEQIKNADKFVSITYSSNQIPGANISYGVVDTSNQYIELESFAA